MTGRSKSINKIRTRTRSPVKNYQQNQGAWRKQMTERIKQVKQDPRKHPRLKTISQIQDFHYLHFGFEFEDGLINFFELM